VLQFFWLNIPDCSTDATLGLVNKSRYSFKEGNIGKTEKKVCFEVLNLRSGLERDIVVQIDLVSAKTISK